MQKRKIELLAPAGNMDALKAAVAAGCDAVYLGSTLFSARAFAGNFDHDQMIEAIRYCHDRDVRVYVTMNTLLYETEIDNAMKEAGFLYEQGADALLVQDFGLFHRLRIEYPDFELHCSTQMHIHNPAGCEFMKKMGAARAVVARETPIEVVKECVKTGIDIEVFAYGAICISYSGQCLMSSAIKHRSGNRGMCAQLCRLRYAPVRDGIAKKDPEGEYLLSPKDLNVIDEIPELIEAGVCSLKIEGRMKRPEYVWLVTRTFREAIDAYYEGRVYKVSEERLRQLMLMFNRGFSEGHLFHADMDDRMSHYRPNHRGVEIGRVLKYENNRVQVKLSAPLYQHDGLRILNEPHDTGLTAVRIWKKDLLVNEAAAGDVVWLECKSLPHPRRNQPLQKTSDSRLLDLIAEKIHDQQKLCPVSLSYEAEIGKPLKLTASDGRGNTVSACSEQIIEAAEKAPLAEEKLKSNLAKAGEFPYMLSVSGTMNGKIFLPVSVLNETRRKVLSRLQEQRFHLQNRAGHQPYAFHLEDPYAHTYDLLVEGAEGMELPENCLALNAKNELPVVSETEHDKLKLISGVIREPGALNQDLSHVIAGMNLNCCNSYSLAFLLNVPGVDSAIFSSECTNAEIERILKAAEARYGFVPVTYRLVYGRRTLMYIKQGFMNAMPEYMKDMEGRIYPLFRNGDTVEVLEPEPYCSDNPYCSGSYVILREEPEEKKKEIIREAYEEIHERV